MTKTVTDLHEFTDDDYIIKFYPYRAMDLKNGNGLVQELTTTFVSVSNDWFDLEVGDNGKGFFEALSAFTRVADVDVNLNSAGLAKTLMFQDRFKLITNDWLQDAADNEPIFVTIDKPYDVGKYRKDEQQLYLISNMNTASELIEQEKEEWILEDDNLIEIDLVNVKTLENTTALSKVIPVENANWYNPKINGKSGIQIEVDSTTLIHSIRGIGKVEGSSNVIDFKVREKLAPVKLTPMSTIDGKVTFFADWFDYDVVLPLFVADVFLTNPAPLKELLNIKVGNKNICSQTELNLLSDVILLSYAYTSNWSWRADLRYNDAEAKAAAGIRSGQLKADLYITTKQIAISSYEGKSHLESVDSLVERYMDENPNAQDSLGFRIIKQMIAAMSKYLYTNYAIGKGKNSFNQIYLPWYLEMIGGITPKRVDIKNTTGKVIGHNYVLDENIKFSLESKWYDKLNGELVIKDGINISDLQMIQTSRKGTVPQVGSVLNPINKLPLPGDVNPKSDNDLKYMFFTGIQTDKEMKKFFLDKAKIDDSKSDVNETFTTNETAAGKSFEDINKFIINEAHDKFGTPIGNITVVSTGTLSPNPEPTPIRLTFAEATKLMASTVQPDDGTILTDRSHNPYFLSWNKPDTVKRALLAIGRPYDEKAIGNMSGEIKVKVFRDGSDYDNRFGMKKSDFEYSTLTVDLIKYSIVGAVVHLKGTIHIIDTNRKTLFDKRGWFKFLKGNDLLKQTKTRLTLQDEYDEPITKVDELTFVGIFQNSYKITYGNFTFELESINKTNNAITTEKFAFT